MDVKYIGQSHFRVIEAADLKPHGITGFSKTTWERGGTQSVPDDAGKWLVDNVGGDFEEVKPEPGTRTAHASSSSASKPSSQG